MTSGGSATWTRSSARAFAARTGATYAGFTSGHFVMMVRRAEVRDTIGKWLQKREGRL